VQAAEEVPHTRLLLSDNGSDDVLIDFLLQSPAMCDQSQTIGIESGHLTVKRWERLRQQLDEKNFGWRLVDGLVEQARRIKFADELEAMRAAGALTASVMTHLESIPVVGRTERDIALELELYLRRRGSEGIAFTCIVAAGPRGAMPHGEASDAVIPPAVLLVVDLGSVVDGYASDLTRTYATGDVTEELRAAYEAVMVAQAEAVAAVRAGIACRDVDKVARDRLAYCGAGRSVRPQPWAWGGP
jgi:Xaa-Pro aminopeptidase